MRIVPNSSTLSEKVDISSICAFINKLDYRELRERVARLEAREKVLQSNVADLKSLFNRVNCNGEERVLSLKTENVS
jgi:hypothetical protein